MTCPPGCRFNRSFTLGGLCERLFTELLIDLEIEFTQRSSGCKAARLFALRDEKIRVVNVDCKRLRLYLFLLAMSSVLMPAASFSLSKKDAEKAGAVLFRDKGCAYCHGPAGLGTGKGPSLANLRKRLKAPQIAAQIENGGQKMPSFRDSLTDDELAKLVSYLRAKHRPVPPPAQP